MSPNNIIPEFSSKKIAVIGDVMLDRYIIGRVDRLSTEAPVPIVTKQSTLLVPGGAGNTAANVTSLGGVCNLTGILGNDGPGEELLANLKHYGIQTVGLLKDKRPTTEKMRIVGNHQQIVRIDHESTAPLSPELEDKLCQRISKVLDSCQAVIVCDYAKGVITKPILDQIRTTAKANSIPVLADVRPEHGEWYHDLTCITPNKKELAGMAHTQIISIERVKTEGLKLARHLRTNLLVTLSEDGMVLIDHKSQTTHHLPTKAQEITDVSGAGDTVIATLALALACDVDWLTAATLANHAASVVVSKLGTATVTQDELLATF